MFLWYLKRENESLSYEYSRVSIRVHDGFYWKTIITRSISFFCVALDCGHLTQQNAYKPICIYIIFFSFLFVQVFQFFSFKYHLAKIYIFESLIIWNCYYLQLCTLITSKYDINLILKVLSHLLPTLVYIVKYNTYYINAEKVSCVHTDLIVLDLNF